MSFLFVYNSYYTHTIIGFQQESKDLHLLFHPQWVTQVTEWYVLNKYLPCRRLTYQVGGLILNANLYY
jgi:hypothetical protein